MTDRIGIDEQIAEMNYACEVAGSHQDETVEISLRSAPEILATLREYKRIQEAKVPESVAFVNRERWDSADHWPDDCFSDVKTGDIEQPLYGPEVLDLLRRETAKNERIKELLREAICKHFGVGVDYAENLFVRVYDDGEGAPLDEFVSEIAALLAEVEKDK